MNSNFRLVLLLILTLTFLCSFLISDPSIHDIEKTIKELKKKLENQQVKKDKKFKPPFSFAEQKGLFKSNVKLNIVDKKGSWEITELRRLFKVPDINMFCTNFVLLSLLDSHDLDNISIDKSSLDLGIDAILKFQSKNYPSGSPIYKFWPQKLINGSWESYPPNLQEPLKFFGSFSKYVLKFLKFLGFEHLYEKISFAVMILQYMATSFQIPADTDDTFCNLALGANLYRHKSLFPESNQKWINKNRNYKYLFQSLLKYSYQPFQNYHFKNNKNGQILEDFKLINKRNNYNFSDNDVIDSRTYYLIHPFLENVEREALKLKKTPKLILPTTWLTNLQNDQKYFPLISMPYHLNNVDVSVVSNVLFGITKHMLTFPENQTKEYFTEDVQKLYSDSIQLLKYIIESNRVLERPDLALVYYPSLYDFYWFLSRIFNELNNYKLEKKHFPFLYSNLFQKALTDLENLLKGKAVPQLLKLMQFNQKKRYSYWDDFLGDYGKKERGEDRLFSTSLAINAIIDAYSTKNLNHNKNNKNGCKRKWDEDVTSEIKEAVQFGINYIHDEILKRDAFLTNAFFSGSTKNGPDQPFFYPSNFDYFINGTKMPNTHDSGLLSPKVITGIKGVVDKETYKNYLERKWFGMDVQTHFDGYNEGAFPFWSSESLTLSNAILAFSKFVETC